MFFNRSGQLALMVSQLHSTAWLLGSKTIDNPKKLKSVVTISRFLSQSDSFSKSVSAHLFGMPALLSIQDTKP